MNNPLFRTSLFAGAFVALAVATSHAQVIELRATLNAAQETPATTSPATGSAIMLYDINANTFDLVVTISNFANTITNSHLHEGAVGVAGSVVTPLGAETVYTRNGNTLTATFRNIPNGGDKLKLIQGGDYYNVHSAQFPGGEIRGQLIPRPKRLVSTFSVAQEQAAFPALTINTNGLGAAVLTYDPAANRVSLRFSVYNFLNTLTNSHFHEGAPGVSGPVVTGLGGATVAGYTSGGGGFYNGSFDIPYTGDPIKLLTGGAYLNFHSNAFSGGELRGQVRATDEVASSRIINVSARGFAGTGSQVLMQGFSVIGPDPVRVLITAKGPSLSAFGVTGALADPVLTLFDGNGRLLAYNNDVGTIAAGSELASIPGVPTNSLESALVVVLPPGNYSALVYGNNGTSGTAVLEVYDLRIVGASVATAADFSELAAAGRPPVRAATSSRGAVELCVGAPLAVAAITR
jgi:hypothetical protein